MDSLITLGDKISFAEQRKEKKKKEEEERKRKLEEEKEKNAENSKGKWVLGTLFKTSSTGV